MKHLSPCRESLAGAVVLSTPAGQKYRGKYTFFLVSLAICPGLWYTKGVEVSAPPANNPPATGRR